MQSFDNGFARNVVIFGVDNSPSSHTGNRRNNILVLGEEPAGNISESVGTAEKNISKYKIFFEFTLQC